MSRKYFKKICRYAKKNYFFLAYPINKKDFQAIGSP